MATERVKGRDLMLFVTLASVTKALAYATNHTLSLSTSEVDVSDKDTGEYSDSEPGQKTWEITSENTYTTESFDALFDAWANNTPVKCVWNTKKETGSTVPEGGWTDEEVALLEAHGFARHSLGPRILRTDTATVALLAQLMPRL